MSDVSDNVTMPTDMYPGGGDTFYAPEVSQEQKAAEQLEIDSMNKAIPIIEEFLADLEGLIAWGDSIDGLDEESKVPLDSQVLAKRTVKNFATKEYQKFSSRYASFKTAVTEAQDG